MRAQEVAEKKKKYIYCEFASFWDCRQKIPLSVMCRRQDFLGLSLGALRTDCDIAKAWSSDLGSTSALCNPNIARMQSTKILNGDILPQEKMTEKIVHRYKNASKIAAMTSEDRMSTLAKLTSAAVSLATPHHMQTQNRNREGSNTNATKRHKELVGSVFLCGLALSGLVFSIMATNNLFWLGTKEKKKKNYSTLSKSVLQKEYGQLANGQDCWHVRC